MAAVISTNYLSLVAQNNLNKSQSALGTAIERLSSGMRINSAKDDAAGQAIANRFTSNVRGLTQAARNANDGISLAQTTEGAVNEINNNLQRIRELTVQANNGSNSGSDLQSIQDEINQRIAEINRVSEQTDFNGVKVLAAGAEGLTIQVGANDNETITIDLQAINAQTLGLAGFDVTNIVSSKNLGDPITKGLTIDVMTDVKVGANQYTPDPGPVLEADGVYKLNTPVELSAAIQLDVTDTTGITGGSGGTLRIVTDGSDYYVEDDDGGGIVNYYKLDLATDVDLTTGKIEFDIDDAAGSELAAEDLLIDVDGTTVPAPVGGNGETVDLVDFSQLANADGTLGTTWAVVKSGDNYYIAEDIGGTGTVDSYTLIDLDTDVDADGKLTTDLTGGSATVPVPPTADAADAPIVVEAVVANYAVKGEDGNYYALSQNPVTGGKYTWDSFTAPIDEANVNVAAGEVTSIDVSVAAPGTITVTGGTVPNGVTFSGLYKRNDVADQYLITQENIDAAVTASGVASGKLVSYDDDGTTKYAVVDDATTPTAGKSLTLNSDGTFTVGADMTADEITAADNANTAVVEGDGELSGYATLGSDGKYYAVTVEFGAAGTAGDPSTWTLTATIDASSIVEVSEGNVAATASTTVAVTTTSVDSNEDLQNVAVNPADNLPTAAGVYALADGSGYAVAGSDGNYYAATMDETTGEVTWTSAPTAMLNAASVNVGTEITEVKTGETDATIAGLAAGETLHEVLDADGNGTGTYVVKGGTADAPTYTYAELAAPNADGEAVVTKGEAATVDPLSMLDNAISKVDELRSSLGAVQNRFESTIANLNNTINNLSAARSRIEDADYAVEVSNMTRAQILQQAGTSVLAQANQVPQSVLSLLR